MYNPEPSTDHQDRGPAHFLEQFKDDPTLAPILQVYLKQVQDLEDAAWEVIRGRNMAEGEGTILDWIGKIVGRFREGLNDSDYLIALAAQIRINRSNGKPGDIIDVTTLSIPAGTPFTYSEDYPCGIIVQIMGQAVFSIPLVFSNLVRTKFGGVRLFLILDLDPPDTVFTCAPFSATGYTSTTYSETQGFGWTHNPPKGGHLTMVIGS